jgi:hypothetical protein
MELFTDSDVYGVSFNESAQLTGEQKIHVLTAQLLADYMFFDGASPFLLAPLLSTRICVTLPFFPAVFCRQHREVQPGRQLRVLLLLLLLLHRRHLPGVHRHPQERWISDAQYASSVLVCALYCFPFSPYTKSEQELRRFIIGCLFGYGERSGKVLLNAICSFDSMGIQ